MKKNLFKLFLLVPIILSTVSAIHIEEFVALGNPRWLSIPIAIAYEIASILIVLFIIFLTNINRTYLVMASIVLIFMQLFGNIYYSYNFIYNVLDYSNVKHIINFKDLLNLLFPNMKYPFIILNLACVMGVPLTLINLLMAKVISQLLEKNNNIIDLFNEEKEKIVEEEFMEITSVPNMMELWNIKPKFRKIGMEVIVEETKQKYRLLNGILNTDWLLIVDEPEEIPNELKEIIEKVEANQKIIEQIEIINEREIKSQIDKQSELILENLAKNHVVESNDNILLENGSSQDSSKFITKPLDID
jgi:hypothetical protein